MTNSSQGELGPNQGDRVAKVLARAGVASRRDAEKLIEQGRVTVDGKTLTTPAVKVTPDRLYLINVQLHVTKRQAVQAC